MEEGWECWGEEEAVGEEEGEGVGEARRRGRSLDRILEVSLLKF
jgi:hypothetical protein